MPLRDAELRSWEHTGELKGGQTMPIYIDAKLAEKALTIIIEKYEKLIPNWSPNDMLSSGKDTAMKFGFKADGVEKALEIIKRLPAADVQPVKHGRWIPSSRYKGIKCSECGYIVQDDNPRLPNLEILMEYHKYCRCGAKMDGGTNDENTT